MGGKSSRQASRHNHETNDEKTEECIKKLPYFYSELSRSQAEDLMRRHINYEGSFLVRLSSLHRRYAITVIVAGKIGHVSIHAPDQNCFYAEDDMQFTKLSDLINHYHDVNLPNNTNEELHAKLKYPVYRFRKPMPFPFQQNAIIYGIRPESGNRAYDSVGEHIEAWRRRWRFDDSPPMSIFQDENGQAISLRIPPRCPRNPIVVSASVEDVTEPKQVIDTPTVSPSRYLQPMRYSKQGHQDQCSLHTECASNEMSAQVQYTPMMPVAVYDQWN